jgi:hypothetical protein
MKEQVFEVCDRVGQVFEWENGSIRKIINGAQGMWNHMACTRNEDGTHTIVGPMVAECGAFCWYWCSEERIAPAVISTETITTEDKLQMALPPLPPCDWHKE